MNENFTQDYSSLEEDASYWLSVFDKLPDAVFSNSDKCPRTFIVNKIKAFARAYKPIVVLGKETDFIIN
ncbi:MAG: hypothetical protein MI866_04155 [Bacteroidales bacterium]|nr:hypothetical protein [Bacteroidales bacterium]